MTSTNSLALLVHQVLQMFEIFNLLLSKLLNVATVKLRKRSKRLLKRRSKKLLKRQLKMKMENRVKIPLQHPKMEKSNPRTQMILQNLQNLQRVMKLRLEIIKRESPLIQMSVRVQPNLSYKLEKALNQRMAAYR